MITDKASRTKRPPTIANTISCLVIIPIAIVFALVGLASLKLR